MDFFNKFYIEIDERTRIVKGFSDAFEQPSVESIQIGQGGTQFRLMPNGEENPPLRDESGIPLYAWDASLATETEPWLGIVPRTPQGIEADRLEQENSIENRIAILNSRIQNPVELVAVTARLYDAVFGVCGALPELAPMLAVFDEPAMSEWRQLVAERDSLMEGLNNGS